MPSTLVPALSQLGLTAELYQPPTGGADVSWGGKVGLLGRRLGDSLRLGSKVRRGGYDLVHIHYAYFGLLGIIGRFPYIIHCHGTDVRSNLYRPLFRGVTRLSIRRALKVYFSTPDLAEHVTPVAPKAEFLPNPIDTRVFDYADDQVSSSDPLRVLIISRLEEIKGVGEAFSALDLLREKHSGLPVEVTCFDWGADAAAHKACYQDHGVKFLSRAPYEKMPEIIAAHDIVIGQLKLGIISMAELEAMASGKPVIGYFAYDDWYPEPPPILPARTGPEIATRIEEVLGRRQLLREVGTAGRTWVVKYHDQAAIAARLASDYEDLAE